MNPMSNRARNHRADIRCHVELCLRRRGPELWQPLRKEPGVFPLSRSRCYYPRPQAQALIVAIVRL